MNITKKIDINYYILLLLATKTQMITYLLVIIINDIDKTKRRKEKIRRKINTKNIFFLLLSYNLKPAFRHRSKYLKSVTQKEKVNSNFS